MMASDSYFLGSHQPSSLDWDPHSFVFGDLHDHTLGPAGSPMSTTSEASLTGYLQDAVADWEDRRKRRRAEAAAEDFEEILQGFWDSSSVDGSMGNLNCLFQDTSTTMADEFIMDFSMPMKETLVEAPKPQEDLLSPPSSSSQDSMTNIEQDYNSRNSKSSQLGLATKDPGCLHVTGKKKKVVYPFTVVKPGGLEGDMTLADINERMLKRPTHPVKHPVGKFAFRPCVRGKGPGLSGKAVVGLTRIHTQGRGTITIIRTRG
ncbi:uncharacterized protein M6B38_145565 [Iris pallida]|uniref:Protein XRI1 n=1 Tax=Iris pallida TaxID=29817 RepID=A0AAX6F8F1_IRIPA|nr:uncharacterized protein M6B38_145565 [Iris pallida]